MAPGKNPALCNSSQHCVVRIYEPLTRIHREVYALRVVQRSSCSHVIGHASHNVTVIVLYDSHHGHYYAPAYNQNAKVDRWAFEPLKKHIGWNFKQNIWHEENRQDDVPLHAVEPEIFYHAFDLRILVI